MGTTLRRGMSSSSSSAEVKSVNQSSKDRCGLGMWCVIYAERRRSGSSLPNLYYPVAGPAAFRDLAYLRRESGSPKPRNYDLIANLANTEPAAVAVAF